jgi:hypothetical protein
MPKKGEIRNGYKRQTSLIDTAKTQQHHPKLATSSYGIQ